MIYRNVLCEPIESWADDVKFQSVMIVRQLKKKVYVILPVMCHSE